MATTQRTAAPYSAYGEHFRAATVESDVIVPALQAGIGGALIGAVASAVDLALARVFFGPLTLTDFAYSLLTFCAGLAFGGAVLWFKAVARGRDERLSYTTREPLVPQAAEPAALPAQLVRVATSRTGAVVAADIADDDDGLLPDGVETAQQTTINDFTRDEIQTLGRVHAHGGRFSRSGLTDAGMSQARAADLLARLKAAGMLIEQPGRPSELTEAAKEMLTAGLRRVWHI